MRLLYVVTVLVFTQAGFGWWVLGAFVWWFFPSRPRVYGR